uniref:Pseudouridylate synthase 7 homolog n=1 Tax=Phallusia mammillata TaxID=59560 RepID=A0A6F9DQ62_9ASCI|nr:pseudouridylate synthase 7 homolog [Phallusia mammillata]
MNELREKDVGITEFVGKTCGFNGIIKLRFQDFLVNEISTNGKVVHLTTFDPPKALEVAVDETCSTDAISKEDRLLLDLLAENNDSQDPVLIKADCDKAQRTEIHKAIKQLYPKLESSTTDDNAGNKVIKVVKTRSGQKRQNQRRSGKRTYCKFVLHKQNIATANAVGMVTSKLGMKHSKVFQYAGNKDKQGITVQEITSSLPYERLAFLTKQQGKLAVGNFTLDAQPLCLGDLSGNYFALIVRNIQNVDEKDISAAMKSFEEQGFINYFGMQRFGATSVPTYEIGKSFLNKNWERAVDQILSSLHTRLDDDTLTCIKNWKEEGQADKLLERLDKKHSLERSLLRGISKFGPTQLTQALTFLPRNTRTMYLHSYQSLVWNKVASKRIKEYGLKPVVGDLVLLDPTDSINEIQDEDAEPPSKKHKFVSDVKVKVLTADDLSLYDITDVVLPLPGCQITYPVYETKNYYDTILKEDEIENTAFDHRVKEYRLPGAYRKLIAKPGMVEWSVVRYDDLEQPLLVSDIERMEGITEPEGKEGHFRALRIKFSLKTSCYATMALREVLKQDMTTTDQIALSDQHKAEVRKHLAQNKNQEDQET